MLELSFFFLFRLFDQLLFDKVNFCLLFLGGFFDWIFIGDIDLRECYIDIEVLEIEKILRGSL